MEQPTTLGVDLSKSVFQLHGVEAEGAIVLKRQLRRSQMLEFFRRLSPCLVGMEACAGAHWMARQLSALGHEAKLISPQFVRPFVKGNKNDFIDAEAICEAAAVRQCVS